MNDRESLIVGGIAVAGAWLLTRMGGPDDAGDMLTDQNVSAPGDGATSPADIAGAVASDVADAARSTADDIASSPQADAVESVGELAGDVTESLGVDESLPGSDTVTDVAADVSGVSGAQTVVDAGESVLNEITGGQSNDTQTDDTQDTVTQNWSEEGLVSDPSGAGGDSGESINVDNSADFADDNDSASFDDNPANRDPGQSTADYADDLGL